MLGFNKNVQFCLLHHSHHRHDRSDKKISSSVSISTAGRGEERRGLRSWHGAGNPSHSLACSVQLKLGQDCLNNVRAERRPPLSLSGSADGAARPVRALRKLKWVNVNSSKVCGSREALGPERSLTKKVLSLSENEIHYQQFSLINLRALYVLT